MKNRQNTENLETTMWVYRCEENYKIQDPKISQVIEIRYWIHFNLILLYSDFSTQYTILWNLNIASGSFTFLHNIQTSQINSYHNTEYLDQLTSNEIFLIKNAPWGTSGWVYRRVIEINESNE